MNNYEHKYSHNRGDNQYRNEIQTTTTATKYDDIWCENISVKYASGDIVNYEEGVIFVEYANGYHFCDFGGPYYWWAKNGVSHREDGPSQHCPETDRDIYELFGAVIELPEGQDMPGFIKMFLNIEGFRNKWILKHPVLLGLLEGSGK